MTETGQLTADELDSVTDGFRAWLEIPVLGLAAIIALGAGLAAMAQYGSWLAAPILF